MKTIKLGNEGDDVALLQEVFVRVGYQVAKSRVFGQGTKDAVIEFQKKHGLDTNGIVGYCSGEAYNARRL
ncbi:peptidoglycan-binding protein [uncultured Bacteroides sp.]|uniref:peptidoglycan-binding domain-containing protein n=1 Tax=uncultured Bacteroides sp. TaxID=162156 RepID=UPI0025F46889|nr:peptidoglycan-binding domain-containing protein [uncultured Bacteroides sp.]